MFEELVCVAVFCTVAFSGKTCVRNCFCLCFLYPEKICITKMRITFSVSLPSKSEEIFCENIKFVLIIRFSDC